ncbi:MAG: hypothetical protein GW898_10385 [Thiomicrospira sp.]|nr:hypothetical protein [Thiomicrospira sp.]NCN66310.1 hypothetical protein [Thiomicrospira sp.]NCO14763.1 hypothetical protein [Thiomicrospira sp.]NCO82360.1 hypothetical protein [Thiomicrospira sp.]
MNPFYIKSLLKLLKKTHKNINNDEKSLYQYNYKIPTYPPFLKGIPFAPVELLLESQKELVDKIKLEVGTNLYESYFSKVIYGYAEFVHLLPASEKHHHRGAGGLLHHGLSVGYNSILYAKAKIFDSQKSPSERESNANKWILAVFIAGLGHDLGKPLSDYKVVNRDSSKTWSPYAGSLTQWLIDNDIKDYFLNWRENRYRKHESFSTFVARKIIPDEIMQFLETRDNRVIQSMIDSISGQVAYDNELYEIIEKADHKSVEMDLKNTKITTDDVNLSVPVEKYILDSIKYLQATDSWNVPLGEAPLVYFEGTLMLSMSAAQNVCDRLEEIKVPGVPWHRKELIEAMLSYGLAREYIDSETVKHSVWPYYRNGVIETLKGIRLNDWTVIFSAEPRPNEDFSHVRFKSGIKDQANAQHQPAPEQRAEPQPQHQPAPEQRAEPQPQHQPAPEQRAEPQPQHQPAPKKRATPKSSPKVQAKKSKSTSIQTHQGLDYGLAIELIKLAIHQKALFVEKGAVAINWAKIPDTDRKPEIVDKLSSLKLLQESTPGSVTHIIRDFACLVLSDKLLSECNECAALINDFQSDNGHKPAVEEKQKRTPRTEDVFKTAFKRVSKKAFAESADIKLNYGWSAKKFHNGKFVQSFIDSGLIELDDLTVLNDDSFADTVDFLKVKLTPKAIKLLGINSELILSKTVKAQPTVPVKSHIEVPADFDAGALIKPDTQKKRVNSYRKEGDKGGRAKKPENSTKSVRNESSATKTTMHNIKEVETLIETDGVVKNIFLEHDDARAITIDRLMGKIEQTEFVRQINLTTLNEFQINMVRKLVSRSL